MLPKAQAALLLDLFRAQDTDELGVHAARFQAKHDQSLEVIDQLLASGWVERREHRFLLRLPALRELAVLDSDARALLEQCSSLFEAIRTAYKHDPGAQIKLKSLISPTEMNERRVRWAIATLCTLALFGYSNDLFEATAYVVPTETILRYRSFDDVIRQYEEWRETNDRNPSRSEVAAISLIQYTGSLHSAQKETVARPMFVRSKLKAIVDLLAQRATPRELGPSA